MALACGGSSTPPPSIISFTSSSPSITAGEALLLTPAFANGTGTIDNGIGTVTSGSSVTIYPGVTTTYTLTVTGASGASVTKAAAVTVAEAPHIYDLTASHLTVSQGESTVLVPTFIGGTGTMDNGVGAVTSGTPVTVTPAATTIYTLSVVNALGATDSQSVLVSVSSAPFIESFNASAIAITVGWPTNLTPVFGSGTGTIDNGVGTVTSGVPVVVHPSATTTYTLTVTDGTTTVTQPLEVTVAPGVPSLCIVGPSIGIPGTPGAFPLGIHVTGPNGYTQTVNAPKILTNLEIGDYTVTGSVVTFTTFLGSHRYRFTYTPAGPYTVSVSNGLTTVTVQYTFKMVRMS